MPKKKTYVKVESPEAENDDVYWKDSYWRIVKIEPKGDPEKRANTKRWLAVLCWIIAIIFEVIWILRLTDVITWFSSFKLEYFLLVCLALDLLFFIPWSLLWKKANHIDPISEKNKTKFWFWNNLWTVLSVLAFLPMIIFVFTSNKLDKKSKTLVWGIAIAAFAIAWIASYDFNPVSSEQLNRAEQEVLQVSPSGTVYWAPFSKKYHVDKDCPAFSNSETVYEGTVRDAYERWLTDPCRRCIPEYRGVDDAIYENNKSDKNDLAEDLWGLAKDLLNDFL